MNINFELKYVNKDENIDRYIKNYFTICFIATF